jgi:hypothetical protein
VIKLTAVIIEAYHYCQLHTTFHPTSFSPGSSHADEITGNHKCGFRRNRSSTVQIFYIRRIPEREKREYNGIAHQLFIGFKKAYDSLWREVLHNILIDFEIPSKLAGQIKMCLNDTCSTVRIGKNQSDMFPIQNGRKQRGLPLYSPLLFNFALEYAIRRV